MVLHVRLVLSLTALALSRVASVHLLEIIEALEDCGSFSWGFVHYLVNEVFEGSLLQSYLVLTLSKVVKYSVDACNDTTGVVKSSCLLHVELISD